MEENLQKLYKECIEELRNIGIDILNSNNGTIEIKMSKRNNKRYGCCKQEEPDKKTKYYEKIRSKKHLRYAKFNKHTIEISKWVMELEKSIIKNTIMHEIIHCFPYCNNHGKEFKKYAKTINEKLGYEISRVGNKKEDYKKSGKIYTEEPKHKYIITCQKCGQTFTRQRLNKKLLYRYRCGRCSGTLRVVENL